MAQRRFHYDQAFEYYLRSKQIPYVSVDEAKKAIHGPKKLKSFDFVVYSQNGANLLVDVKGRKHSGRTPNQLDNWVTEDDIVDLLQWEQVFGDGFKSTLVFLYWCATQPPDALFQEIFAFKDRWYSVLAIDIHRYRKHMKTRSAKWQTVCMPADVYRELSNPLMKLL
ncbi:MAG: HYExAFE family protein [Planctomycetota bacterium]|jgi:hypothetical protein